MPYSLLLLGLGTKKEAAMRENESHYRIIFEHSNDAIFLMDPERNRILEANPKARDLLGYDQTELDMLHPQNLFEDRRLFRDFMRSVLSKNSGQTDALNFLTRCGKLIPTEISASGFFDSQNLRMVLFIARDIAERREAENKVAQLERRKQWILNSAGEGIYGLDLEGRVTFINPTAARLLGYEVGELQGEFLHESVHHTRVDGQPYAGDDCPICSSYRDGQVCEVEDELFWRKDGQSIPVEYVSTPALDENGEVVGAVVTFKDITQRKKAEKDLGESEERFRAIFNTVGDAIVIRDLDSDEAVDVNGKMCEMFGFSRKDTLKLNLSDISWEQSEEAADMLRRYRDKARVGIPQTFEWQVRRRSGRSFWVEVHMKRADIAGMDRILVVLRDITLRKEAEQEALDLNRDLERRVKERTAQLEAAQAKLVENAHRAGMADIASSVLHNVGNVLTSVSTSSQVITGTMNNAIPDRVGMANRLLAECLQNEGLGNNPKGEQLMTYYSLIEKSLLKERNIIRENSERIESKIELIRDVILAQQTYASRGFQSEELTLLQVVEEALSIQQNDILNHQVKVDLDFGDNPKIYVQKNKLIHVLVNLLKNAFEAMPSDKNVTITGVNSGRFAYLKIRDTGRGIHPDHLDRIFSHGFTTKKKGHGFGLHTCANAMTEMGGSIWAESDGPGKGATFVLKFDLEKKYRAAS